MALKSSVQIGSEVSASVGASKTVEVESTNKVPFIDLMRSTFGVSEEGDPTISFSMSEVSMKGVCKEIKIPLAEIPSFVETVSGWIHNGLPSEEESKSVSGSATEVLKKTVKKSDGRVFLRTSGGHGSKPTSIPEADLPVLVNILRMKSAAIKSAALDYKD